MPTAHSSHHVEYPMFPNDIYTVFSKALGEFEPISGQPTDSYLAELHEVLQQIFLVIPYDKKNGVHNLVDIIQYTTTYTTDYTITFPRPCNLAI